MNRLFGPVIGTEANTKQLFGTVLVRMQWVFNGLATVWIEQQ